MSAKDLKPCPFCGGLAKEPIRYNGTLETLAISRTAPGPMFSCQSSCGAGRPFPRFAGRAALLHAEGEQK
jgi:hypothetical protein